jgi:hypothetical protein
MSTLKAVLHVTSIGVMALAALPAIAATVNVTNNNGTGAGSFRAAVDAANGNSAITSIRFNGNLGTIALETTVVYSGAQPLSIDGRGTDIMAAAAQTIDLFVAEGGGDLTLRNLTFRAGDNGVLVEVPASAEGQVSVALYDVTVVDNLRFGLSIDEDDPIPGEPFAASISLVVASSHFARNGLLATEDEDEGDVDAVRVNERGDGDITAAVIGSVFFDNGADGFELDEEGLGDTTLTALGSSFDDNGVAREGGDDGLDIDESEDGSIWLNVVDSTFNGSTDDGIGLDESDDGDLHITLVQVEASANEDSGISADEGDSGNYEAKFVLVTADENEDKGADMTEAGAGDFDGRAVTSSFSFNLDDGIAVEQLDGGSGALQLIDTTVDGNGSQAIDADGVTVTQFP